MAYCPNQNILFIHIPKCAGKSFEVASGVITKQESIKYNWRNNLNRLSKFLLSRTADKKALQRLWGTYDISLSLQHVTYAEIELLGLLDTFKLKKAIKVAIIRNPYDRAVSLYHHHKEKSETFLEFLNRFFTPDSKNHNFLAHKRNQLDFIRDKKGNIILDFVIRFENLNQDFKDFSEYYELNLSELPHIGKNKGRKTYQEYYCKVSKEIVANLFSDDISYFDYTF